MRETSRNTAARAAVSPTLSIGATRGKKWSNTSALNCYKGAHIHKGGGKMTIILRNSGDQEAAVIIGEVCYCEMLPNCIQYTTNSGEGVQEIGIVGAGRDFEYEGTVYDFCQVYA